MPSLWQRPSWPPQHLLDNQPPTVQHSDIPVFLRSELAGGIQTVAVRYEIASRGAFYEKRIRTFAARPGSAQSPPGVVGRRSLPRQTEAPAPGGSRQMKPSGGAAVPASSNSVLVTATV